MPSSSHRATSAARGWCSEDKELTDRRGCPKVPSATSTLPNDSGHRLDINSELAEDSVRVCAG